MIKKGKQEVSSQDTNFVVSLFLLGRQNHLILFSFSVTVVLEEMWTVFSAAQN